MSQHKHEAGTVKTDPEFNKTALASLPVDDPDMDDIGEIEFTPDYDGDLTSALTQIAHWLRGIERRLAHWDNYEELEMEATRAKTNKRRDPLLKQQGELLSIARSLTERAIAGGKGKSVPLPNVGMFSIRAGSVSVDTLGFKGLPLDKQKEIAGAFEGLFEERTVVTIAPVAPQIKSMLVDGIDIPGCELVKKPDSFTFTADVGSINRK